MDSKVISKIYFLIIFLSTTHLYAVEFQGKFLQGHFIIGVTDPLAKIIIDKKKLEFHKMVILFLELGEIEILM